MTRYLDWEARLEAYLLAARGTQFKYGACDCCTFALDGVRAITGHDFAASYRDYSSYKQGRKMIQEQYGAKNLKSFLEFVLADLKPVVKGYQQRGDLVLVSRGVKKSSNPFALAIVSLSGSPVCMDLIGYKVMSNESVVRGWKT